MTTLLERARAGRAVRRRTSDEPYWSSFLVADPTRRLGARDERAHVGRPRRRRRRRDLEPHHARHRLDPRVGRRRRRAPTSTTWRDPDGPADAAIADATASRGDATRCSSHDGTTAGRVGPRRPRSTLRTARLGAPGRDVGPPTLRHGVTRLHARRADYVEATTASMVAELPADREAPLRAWVALGSPCASVYVPVFPPAGVPAALAERRDVGPVRGAARPGRGRRRRSSPAVRAVLGPLEAELWAARPTRAAGDPAGARRVRRRDAWTRGRRRARRGSASDARAALGSVGMEYNLADLWEKVVDTVPDREALVCGDRRLTYADADERANRLAHYLGRAGHRSRRPRRALPLQRHRVPRGRCSPRSSSAPSRSTSTTATSRTSCATCSTTPTRRPSSSTASSRRSSPRSATELPALARRTSPSTTAARTTSTPLDAIEYEAALARRVAGARLRAALGRRPLHPLHRRHDRHAEGCDVAPRGHLLRRARRRRHRRHADRDARGDRASAPRAGAPAACPACPFMHGTAHWMAFTHALQRRHRRHLARPPLRSRATSGSSSRASR